MAAWRNYLGQLRLYSLVDLIIVLIAVQATPSEFIGALLLWVGFLFFLEERHRHHYRTTLPKYGWAILFVLGLMMFGHWQGVIFILLGYFYSLKTNHRFGLISPFIRGAQNYILISGIVGLFSPLALLAFGLTALRNVIGDWRDADKDRAEGMLTWPVTLGGHNLRYGHLLAVFITTAIWWQLSGLAAVYLLAALIIEALTYNLTAR